MTKTFDVADPAVYDLAKKAMKKREPELDKAGVSLMILLVHGGEPPQLKVGGYAAAAKIKINNVESRSQGMADATIQIDNDVWLDLSARKQEALIAHELHHLEVCYDKDGKVKLDTVGRPKLKTRLHDHQIGIFEDILADYGEECCDHDQVQPLKIFYEQRLMPWG